MEPNEDRFVLRKKQHALATGFEVKTEKGFQIDAFKSGFSLDESNPTSI